MPFIARGPGIPRGETSSDVVSNADVVPTFMGLAGATPGLVQDGQSLMPSLQNPELEQGRAILHEAYAGQQILGVRTSQYLYTEWETDLPLFPDVELYDNYADPYQLNNLAREPAYAGVVSALSKELDQLIELRRRRLLLASDRPAARQRGRQRPEGLHPGAADRERGGDRRAETIGSVTFRVEGDRARHRHRAAVLGRGARPTASQAAARRPAR